MTKYGALVIALSMGIMAPGAFAAPLFDDFNDGTLAGWPSPNVGAATLSNPGAGGNLGGYVQAFRDVGNPSHYLSTKYTGDWGALVGGTELLVSVDLRVEDAGNIETLRFEISNPTFSDIWRRDIFSGVAPFPFIESGDSWVTINYPINVNWTDAEANAAGWTRVFPSGTPKSFSQVLHDVSGNLTGFTHAGNQFVGGGRTNAVGLDNFRVAAVPEPGSISLLVVGAALVLTPGIKRHMVRRRDGKRLATEIEK